MARQPEVACVSGMPVTCREIRNEQDAEIRRLKRQFREAKRAIRALYTFPGVRELLAPIESLGSIAALVEDALKPPRIPRVTKADFKRLAGVQRRITKSREETKKLRRELKLDAPPRTPRRK